MNSWSFQLPWLVVVVLIVFALYGFGIFIAQAISAIRFFLLIRRVGYWPTEKHRQEWKEQFVSEADRKAHAILDQTTREVWLSLNQVEWMNFQTIRTGCQTLVENIAAVYYPRSRQPLYEVTPSELLKLFERISQEINQLLSAFPTLQQISVASIFEAKNLFEQTKRTLDKKGIQTGRKIASRIWSTVNAVNPNYWIKRAIFSGASEVVGRKIVTSIYRIVGTEAIRIYRSSSTLHYDPYHDSILSEKKKSEDRKSKPKYKADEKTGESQRSYQKTDAEPDHFDGIKNESMDKDQKVEYILPEEEPEQEPSANEAEGATDSRQKWIGSITNTLSSFVEGSMQLWEKLANPETILETFRKKGFQVNTLDDLSNLPVNEIDKIVDSYIRTGRYLSATEGAVTGAGGFLLMGADMVSLLALQLRTIQQIGYCYGFDVCRPEEKLFAAKLLAESYQHPIKQERQAIMNEMRMAANLLKGKTPFGLLQNRLFVQGFAKIAQKIGIKMGSRKTAQLVPLLGSAVGGIINQKITYDIAQVAKEVYRERFNQQKPQ